MECVIEKEKQLEEKRLQKFCKKHKSIWGKYSWYCLWSIWMDKFEKCEEEYLEVLG